MAILQFNNRYVFLHMEGEGAQVDPVRRGGAGRDRLQGWSLEGAFGLELIHVLPGVSVACLNGWSSYC